MDPQEIIAAFFDSAHGVSIDPLTAGHINDSFVVAVPSVGGAERYVLQRLNTRIFPRPAEVMENVDRITQHLRAKRGDLPPAERRRRAPVLRRALDGRPFACDADGGWWRLLEFVEGSRTRLTATSLDDARAAARAFGEFQRLLEDLPPPRLHDTLPGFHDTPARVAALREAISMDAAGRSATVQSEIAVALEGASRCSKLLAAAADGRMPLRVVHNDAKISNVLFDDGTNEPLCVIDYDIVMPGLSLFDFGDMVRSMACSAAEDEPDMSRIHLDHERVEALVSGYLEAVGSMLTPTERSLLVFAGWLITYEQAVRFLADYLRGDVYYRCERPGHNLERARAQFRLASLLESDRDALERIVSRAI